MEDMLYNNEIFYYYKLPNENQVIKRAMQLHDKHLLIVASLESLLFGLKQ